MPTIDHFLGPLMLEKFQEISAKQPTPEQAQEAQANTWVAKKDAEYARFGATPEQRAQWADYNKMKYQAFLSQTPGQKSTQTQPTSAAPKEPSPAERQKADAQSSFMSALGYLPASYNTGTTPAIRAKPYEKAAEGVESFDPQLNPMQAEAAKYAYNPNDPGYLQSFKRGAMRGFDRHDATTMIPNVPAELPVEAPKGKRGKQYLKTETGAPVGYAEDGQAIDSKGKKLGYMAQPALITPSGDTAIRTADKQRGDVSMGDQDPFAAATLDQLYGPHLKELRSNNNKFPAGYFKTEYEVAKKNKTVPSDMTLDAYKENVQNGVKELQRRENEHPSA